MQAYKDEKRNTWYVKLSYKDNQGKRHDTTLRGYKTKKAALEAGNNHILEKTGSCDMLFRDMYVHYLNEKKARTKYTTWSKRDNEFQKHILPFFGEMPVQKISVLDIRKWQDGLLLAEHNGEYYSRRYIYALESALSNFFNWAMKCYSLKENPLTQTGKVGSKKSETEMKIWTEEQFQKAVELEEDPEYYLGLNVLFYTGMRLGELRGLTWDRIDLENRIITIDRQLQNTGKKEELTSLKTTSSERKIKIDEYLAHALEDYKNATYDPDPSGLVFGRAKNMFGIALHRLADKAELEHIRIHDLRHSHASYLIHIGVNIVLISKRLGHESTKMTLDTYSHLYPDDSMSVGDLITQNRENFQKWVKTGSQALI